MQVLEELENQFPEFVSCYKSVINLAKQNGVTTRAALTFNPKLARTKMEPWLYTGPELVNVANEADYINEEVWYAMQRFAYSSEFNEARDQIRFALEMRMPEEAERGSWDHLELFVDDLISPRNGENSRKRANQNNLNSDEGYLPQTPKIGQALIMIAKAETVFQTLRELYNLRDVEVPLEDTGRPAWYVLEQIISSTKDENLRSAKEAGARWAQNYTIFKDRESKVRLVRAVRTGVLPLNEAIREYNRPAYRTAEIRPVAGKTLRKHMAAFTSILEDKNSDFDKAIQFVEAISDIEDVAKENLLTLLRNMKDEFTETYEHLD